MNVADQEYVELLRLAAGTLTGHKRRVFVAEVTIRLCDGNARQSEERFGWGRETVGKGLQELEQGIACVDNFQARGRTRAEDRQPKLAADIREIAEPKTQADPELKSNRRYTNLSAREVRQALIEHKHWRAEDLPSERSLRRILNRMNYRLKRIQKGRPRRSIAASSTKCGCGRIGRRRSDQIRASTSLLGHGPASCGRFRRRRCIPTERFPNAKLTRFFRSLTGRCLPIGS